MTCWNLVCVVVSVVSSIAAQVAADDPKTEVDIRSDDGKVLLAADQIRSYDWATHTLTLAPKAREELFKKLPNRQIVAGIPFALTVGGKTVYQGTFTTILSSRSFATPVILVGAEALEPTLGADQIRIQLGYPTADFFKGEDTRGDDRVRAALKAAGKLAVTKEEHTEWIARSLKEMQTIKPGMSREELLKVFKEEGGLSTRTQRRYTYRDCPYIKVEVTFEAVGAPADKLTESPNDKITRISKPFLEWSIVD